MGANLFFSTLTSGTFIIPDGFIFASIDPESSGTYTITNSQGEVSGTISASFSFPSIDILGWEQHTITWVSGTIIIAYATGR